MLNSALPYPDNRHLDAAEGWIGLGSYADAQAELEQIRSPFQTHPVVLEVRYKVCAGMKRWAAALELADTLRRLLPEFSWGYFHAAYALHELKRTQEAYDTLAPVVTRFPDDYMMRFNLACYTCQLGKFEESMEWLKTAIALADDTSLQEQALEDRDLEPLWAKIRQLGEN